ncbi:chemotaxis protein [Fervidobacterium sp. SC_NGM5_O18]|uniref:Peptide/nickel transport system ATP-binding protein n=1 Tax=Fervidobacterium gondwanense DSM 13020 TaxID=1121883 RepID=A0A1M7T3F5_FERGO|nr:ABC transporter ATP-binding protein [Fervidobacterium gondwanense]PHJ13324.1 chemotaxis protein [Fervidobacterium sp. SC_NGM5_O18]PHJ13593.1 chemotaxis protein [Fervidobacterium sp. SC_NGM5_G05]UXF01711.1 chemotaxis protein [Fervidobacterium riparium]SHN65197.1 peptide/nickel transport system ATP-binding protein [Fervidobacterium gondwanense DSM 13020]
MSSILIVKNLTKEFLIRKGFKMFTLKALRGIDLELYENEIVSVVGESGCGKTTFLRVLARIYEPTSGSIELFGKQVPSKMNRREELEFRRQVQMVFQDPFASLNPTKRLSHILERPLKIHKIPDKSQTLENVLTEVELTPVDNYLEKFPHELSGGQRQRVVFARAIITKPRIILADEPTSMLDVSIKSGILNLMIKLKEEFHISFIHVTHDLAAAKYVSDRIAVMYAGLVVEEGNAKDIVNKPMHPYTMLLKEAAPDPEKANTTKMVDIGEPPSLITPPPGCPFEPRCKFSKLECKNPVELRQVNGRKIRCVLY